MKICVDSSSLVCGNAQEIALWSILKVGEWLQLIFQWNFNYQKEKRKKTHIETDNFLKLII